MLNFQNNKKTTSRNPSKLITVGILSIRRMCLRLCEKTVQASNYKTNKQTNKVLATLYWLQKTTL